MYKQRRKNKYNAKTQKYNGYSYDSIKEANYARELDWRVKAGEIKEVINQYKIDIRIDGKHWRNYYIDFKLIMADGSIEYHEVKGFATEVWKMKWDACKILFPDWKFVVIY
jgi:hypothetical protein